MITPQEMVERALALSRADGCIVIADETSSANLRWANNALTTNGVVRGRWLTVMATREGATGTAVGVVSRREDPGDTLEAVVRAAEAAAQQSIPAEDAQPLVESGSASVAWEAPPAETSIAAFSGFTPALGAALSQARGAGRLLFGYAEHTVRSTYLASSSGLHLHHDQTFGYIELNAKPVDLSSSTWLSIPTADFSDIAIATLDAQLGERLRWAQRHVELPAGRYETILPPAAVADLMGYMYMSSGALDAHDGRTVFSKPGGGTRVGEQLTTVPVNLRSDPAALGLEREPFVLTHASSAFASVFDNGLPLQPTSWIKDGKLCALIQTRHSAQVTGLPLTPMIGNLIMEGPRGGSSLTEMVAGTGRGLLLTSLFYIRQVAPQTLLLTGLTRDGVYLVEKGEVVGAVNNFRFNESPVDLLGRIAEIGATERTLGRMFVGFFRTAMPPLRIGDFNMSTVSQAL